MITTKRFARLLLPALAAVGVLTAASASSAAANPPTDFVRLTGVNLDFGDWGLMPPPGNDPLGFGLLEWDTSGGTVTPHLTGELYINNGQGLHARMQMRYYDVFGNVLTTKVGGEVAALDNGTWDWNVDLAPYSNPSIYKVVVSTTYKVGTNWYTKSAQTFYI